MFLNIVLKSLGVYGIGVLSTVVICPMCMEKSTSQYDVISFALCAAVAVFWPVTLPCIAYEEISRRIH